MSKASVGLALALLLASLVVAGVLAAGQANSYRIARWTVDNGGGVSAGERYSLAGTIGQPDASTVMTGGMYRLTGGYWGAASGYTIFLPLTLRQS